MSTLASTLPPNALLWMWQHPTKGTLMTVFAPDGEVSEMRLHRKDAAASHCSVGRVSAGTLTALTAAAQPLLEKGVNFAQDESKELYSLGRVGADGALTERWVPATELPRDAAMSACRKAALAARNEAEGGRFAWRSLAGRLFWICLVVTGFLLVLHVMNSNSSNALEKEAQRLTGIVTERSGKTGYDQSKYIKVRFTPQGGTEQEAKTSEYLSAENWEAATPGSEVKLFYHPKEGVHLESDILRFQGMKHWILLLPLVLMGIAIGSLLLIPHYRVGVHADGQEYIVSGDRVLGDDKDMPISRLSLNVGRVLWRMR